MTPGERTSWDTTTRSVPLITNVPFSVIMGKSPMKTVCSLISPVVAFTKRARTKMGAEKVMSFSLHSSTENLGGGRRSSSSGSNSSSSCRVSVKSLMGEMSAKVSFRPCSRNHWKDSRWIATRSGSGSTCSMFANEYRSLMRVDNESLLKGFGGHGDGKRTTQQPWPSRGRGRRDGRGRARRSRRQRRQSRTTDARQLAMLGRCGRKGNTRNDEANRRAAEPLRSAVWLVGG